VDDLNQEDHIAAVNVTIRRGRIYLHFILLSIGGGCRYLISQGVSNENSHLIFDLAGRALSHDQKTVSFQRDMRIPDQKT